MRALLLSLALGSAVPGCISEVADQPALLVTPESFERSVRTLCLRPLVSELALDEAADAEAAEAARDPRLVEFEEQWKADLRRRGFSLVEAARVETVWSQATRAGPGPYDALTGRVDPEAWAAAESRARARLREELGCDLTVRPRLAVVLAPFGGAAGAATWDGTEQAAAQPLSGEWGWVRALSLWVSMRDARGRLAYFGTGGIELLSTLDPNFFTASDIEDRDPSSLLRSEERNLAAIALAHRDLSR